MQHSRVTVSFAICVLAVFLGANSMYADEGTIHEVQAGETLSVIAAQHGLTAGALIRANELINPDLIQVGQQLTIPTAVTPKSPGGATSAPAVKPRASVYVVQRGQTLAQIARSLDTSVAALASANGLTNPDRIAAGTKLIVPGSVAGPIQDKVTDTRFIASISSQRCWLYEEGQLIGDWACSSGRKEAPTVPGTYKIRSMIEKAYGSRWDFWMPYWLGLYFAGSTENGIHGLPYSPKTGRRTWEGLVGTPITYGCIMLEDVNAKLLFETAYLGMPVVILP